MATKKKRKEPPFVKVPLWWAESAAKATKDPAALVWIHLLHTAWKRRSMTVLLANGHLEKIGVSRKVKYRVLHDLKAAGLITVEQPSCRSPRVTIVVL